LILTDLINFLLIELSLLLNIRITSTFRTWR